MFTTLIKEWGETRKHYVHNLLLVSILVVLEVTFSTLSWLFICVVFATESLCLLCTCFHYAATRLATMLSWVVQWCEHSLLTNLAFGSYPRGYAVCGVKVIRSRSKFNAYRVKSIVRAHLHQIGHMWNAIFLTRPYSWRFLHGAALHYTNMAPLIIFIHIFFFFFSFAV